MDQEREVKWCKWFAAQVCKNLGLPSDAFVMVASYLSSSYLISASNLSAHLISYLIYGCGLVSS